MKTRYIWLYCSFINVKWCFCKSTFFFLLRMFLELLLPTFCCCIQRVTDRWETRVTRLNFGACTFCVRSRLCIYHSVCTCATPPLILPVTSLPVLRQPLDGLSWSPLYNLQCQHSVSARFSSPTVGSWTCIACSLVWIWRVKSQFICGSRQIFPAQVGGGSHVIS